MTPIVLASTSPQRRELMTKLGLPFRIVAPDFEEHSDPSLSPAELAKALALGKARSVVDDHPGAVIIGADTVVVVAGQAVSKPASPDEARRFLHGQRNGSSNVVTGVAVIDTRDGTEQNFSSENSVRLRNMTDDEVEAYLSSGEGLDKAGAMAVSIVDKVDGDINAVMGLPVTMLASALTKVGLSPREPAA